MDINIPVNVKNVLDRLTGKGYEAFIVGGCVRDSLLGVTPKDYDVTTNALPEEIVACFKDGFKVIPTGIKHGTVTVVSGGENVEVTTYRVDGSYTDHRRPDSVSFTGVLEEDLARRDFTVNAMAYSHERGVIDPYGGQRDLFTHKIRCVGSPDDRFGEDALRIMRSLRFASVLDFRIDRETAEAVHRKKSLLREISAERIMSELTGFVMGSSPAALMMEFDDVLCTVIPEFTKCIGFNQRSRYHKYDVWEHTARSLESSVRDREIRLALLFHDIEKPSCFYLDDEGQGHFPGHEKKSAQTAERIMKRLRFDNQTVKNVCSLIKYHYITPVDDRRVVRRMLSVMGLDMLEKLTEVMKGDSRAKQEFCIERVNTLDAMKRTAVSITEASECCTLSALEINGRDLEGIGLSGKAIGSTLEKLLDMVMDETVPNEKEALLAAAEEFSRLGENASPEAVSSDSDSHKYISSENAAEDISGK